MPAVCVHDTMLKKLGLPESADDPKEVKKHQLLYSFLGEQRALAEDVLADLLGLQAQAV
jgi:hypothetical protein